MFQRYFLAPILMSMLMEWIHVKITWLSCITWRWVEIGENKWANRKGMQDFEIMCETWPLGIVRTVVHWGVRCDVISIDLAAKEDGRSWSTSVQSPTRLYRLLLKYWLESAALMHILTGSSYVCSTLLYIRTNYTDTLHETVHKTVCTLTLFFLWFLSLQTDF